MSGSPLPPLPYTLPENREAPATWNPVIGYVWTYRGPTLGAGWQPPVAVAATGAAPVSPTVGTLWFDGTKLMVWNGSWVQV